jgi:hypothetical protein
VIASIEYVVRHSPVAGVHFTAGDLGETRAIVIEALVLNNVTESVALVRLPTPNFVVSNCLVLVVNASVALLKEERGK